MHSASCYGCVHRKHAHNQWAYSATTGEAKRTRRHYRRRSNRIPRQIVRHGGEGTHAPRHATNLIVRKQPLKHPLLSVGDAFTSFSGGPLLLQQILYTRCPPTLKNRVLTFIAYSATQPSFWVMFDKLANSEAVLFGIRKSLLLIFPPVRFWETVFLLCPLLWLQYI